jgi:hypothetical protein
MGIESKTFIIQQHTEMWVKGSFQRGAGGVYSATFLSKIFENQGIL